MELKQKILKHIAEELDHIPTHNRFIDAISLYCGNYDNRIGQHYNPVFRKLQYYPL